MGDAARAARGRIRIFHGAGPQVPVDSKDLRRERGTVKEVLKRVVRDPELQAELEEANTVVDQRVNEPGESFDTALSVHDPWERVVDDIEAGRDVELYVAKRHVGGAEVAHA